jgi:hypothetical protein
VPTTQVAFNPRRSYAGYCRLYYLGPAYPTVRWGWEPDTTALVRYQGAQGSLVPGATFYLKAKLQPQPGYSLPSGTRIEDINSFRFRGWAVSRVSSTELIYYYGSPARNATTLELIPPPLTPDIYPNPSVGYLFYSTKQLPDPWRFRIEVGITVPTGLQSLPKVPPVVYYFQR